MIRFASIDRYCDISCAVKTLQAQVIERSVTKSRLASSSSCQSSSHSPSSFILSDLNLTHIRLRTQPPHPLARRRVPIRVSEDVVVLPPALVGHAVLTHVHYKASTISSESWEVERCASRTSSSLISCRVRADGALCFSSEYACALLLLLMKMFSLITLASM